MKKIISLSLSVVLALSSLSFGALTAFANTKQTAPKIILLKRMKHALKALKDNERWVREIALLRKEYEEK